MARPKRIQIAGGVYHAASGGVDHCAMFRGVADRTLWQVLYAKALVRYEWTSLIYCEMTTHVHMIIETALPNIARGMQWLNGTYAQAFNQRHGRHGHLFRGRYAAVVIQSDFQYAAAWAYVAHNPVRAGLCVRAQDWPWSGIAPGTPLPNWDMGIGNTGV
jgi:putative transposase